MPINASSNIKKILIITLTNIGDAILTFPVIDVLINAYPQAEISVVAAPKSQALFENNPYIKQMYVYDKKDGLFTKLDFIFELKNEKFDCVIDLKNSMIPFLMMPKYSSKPEVKKDESLHMKEKHLQRLKSIYEGEFKFTPRHLLIPNEEDLKFVDSLLLNFIESGENYIVVAPGSLNEHKRWGVSNYQEVCQKIIKDYGCKIIFVGDGSDGPLADRISEGINEFTLNLCGNTSLIQCAEVIRRALMALTNDSGPMHIASYLNIPVVAVFGPSKAYQYGPWSDNAVYLKGNVKFYNDDLKKDQTSFTEINSVSVEQVFNSFKINKGLVEIYNEKNI